MMYYHSCMTQVFLTKLFIAATAQFGLPQGLLPAICYVESKHNIHAVHHDDGASDSIGICQIKLLTARMLGYTGSAKGLMIPQTNIYFSAKFLKYQLKRYRGDSKKAITAYNKGHSSGDGHSTYYNKVTIQWDKYGP